MNKYLLTIFLLVVGCAQKQNLQTSQSIAESILVKDKSVIKPDEKAIINRGQVANDINLLIHMLKQGYAGAKHVPQSDFNSALKSLNEFKMAVPDKIEVLPFCRQLAKIIEIIPDRHIKLDIEKTHCSSSSNIKGRVGQNYGKEIKSKAWELNFKKISDFKSVPVLSIHFFPSYDDSKWNGFHEAVENKIMKHASALIIDLRGNGGGDDSQGSWLAHTLYGGNFSSPYSSVINRQTPEALALFINTIQSMVEEFKKDNKPVPDDVNEYLKTYQENFDLALKGKIPEEDIVSIGSKNVTKFDPKKGFNKPIYIIVDKECGSSGESTLALLKMHPNAKTFGENTYGAIHIGNQGYFYLPESKIKVKMGSHFVESSDKRYYEVSGYPPDVKTPSDQDAFGTVLKFVKRDLRSSKTKKFSDKYL